MDTVVISAARTPFGKFGGSLRGIPVIDISSMLIKEVIKRGNIEPGLVDEINIGVCTHCEAKDVVSPVIARQALLKAGLPAETVSLTIDRACCSAMTAIQLGIRGIKAKDIKVAIGGGAENFSRTPFILRELRWGKRLGNAALEDPLFAMGYKDFNPVSVDAGEVAIEMGITREMQDEWAYISQKRYEKAFLEGKFKDEIMSVEIPQRKGPPIIFDRDEFPKPDTTIEKLSKLPTIYGSPTVTAGNAPGLNDGGAAVLIMSRDMADSLSLEPLATIVTSVSTATLPRYITTIPAIVIKKALEKANLSIDDIDIIEINEAFAAMPLASSLILADQDWKKAEKLREKINVNGGAIAIGHPNGASGARILMTMIYELRRRGGGYGIAAICGGLAQGDAIVVKV